MVDGIGGCFDAIDGAVSLDGTDHIGVVSAGDEKIVQGGSRDRGAVRQSCTWVWESIASDNVAAVAIGDGLAGREGIVRSRNDVQLVGISLVDQMRSLAADVGDGSNEMSRQFLLHVQVPLLHVGRIGPVWKREWVYGEGETSADIGIAWHVALIGDEHERRSALLQDFGVGFVPVFVLKEYS